MSSGAPSYPTFNNALLIDQLPVSNDGSNSDKDIFVAELYTRLLENSRLSADHALINLAIQRMGTLDALLYTKEALYEKFKKTYGSNLNVRLLDTAKIYILENVLKYIKSGLVCISNYRYRIRPTMFTTGNHITFIGDATYQSLTLFKQNFCDRKYLDLTTLENIRIQTIYDHSSPSNDAKYARPDVFHLIESTFATFLSDQKYHREEILYKVLRIVTTMCKMLCGVRDESIDSFYNNGLNKAYNLSDTVLLALPTIDPTMLAIGASCDDIGLSYHATGLVNAAIRGYL